MISPEQYEDLGDPHLRPLHPQALSTLNDIFEDTWIPDNISEAGAAALAEELSGVYLESLNGESEGVKAYGLRVCETFRLVMAGEDIRGIARQMGYRRVDGIQRDMAGVREMLQIRNREDFDGQLFSLVVSVLRDNGEHLFVRPDAPRRLVTAADHTGHTGPADNVAGTGTEGRRSSSRQPPDQAAAPHGRSRSRPPAEVAAYPEDLVALQAQSAARVASAYPETLPWQSRGLCAFVLDIEIFSPPKEAGKTYEGDIRRAKRVCGACAVRAECLDDALKTKATGIRAGTTTRERKHEKQT